jgi:hypothetical protein
MLSIGVATGSVVVGILLLWSGLASSVPQWMIRRPQGWERAMRIPQRMIAVIGPVLIVWVIGGAIAVVAPLPAMMVVMIALAGVVIGILQYRAPQRDHERRRRAIDHALLSLINTLILYRQLGISSADMCRGYIQTANRENQALVSVIRMALEESIRTNRRPFLILGEYADTIGSDLFREVAAAMQEYEQEGVDVGESLIAMRRSIGRRIRSRVLQQIERRKLALLGISAVSVLVGVVIHILYVAIVGGRVWDIVSGAIG